jgi:hypothetical protein
MWLYILIGVVIILLVFLMGSYSAKTPPTTLGEIKAATCESPDEKPAEPKGCCNTGAASYIEEEPKRCKKHRRRRCYVCKSTGDDGFSTGSAFTSGPADFNE